MTPTEFRETHPWLMSREQYKRQRAFRRLRNRLLIAASVVYLIAGLAVVIVA